MARLAWATDVHLNFLSDEGIDAFVQQVRETGADATVITGDISEAPSIVDHVQRVRAGAGMPVYFVLGNHDFYRGSLGAVRTSVKELGWLPEVGAVELSASTGLIGCDGWGDARLGDFENSDVMLNDYLLIADLRAPSQSALAERLHAEGDRWGAWVRANLPGALQRWPHVVFATHVPPFDGACWHEGKVSDAHWLPHFTCKAVGDALLECAATHPSSRVTVLCGHTHGAGTMEAADNLVVRTGGAEYGAPCIADVLDV